MRQIFARKTDLIQAVGLKIDNAQNCKAWLAQLPLSNAPVAQGALAAQLKLLNEAEVTAAARLKVMEQLREPVLFVQGERAKRYSNQPVPLDLTAAAVWVDVIALWQAMLQGYEACLGVDALSRPLVHQRLLEYTGLVMEDHNRIYRVVPAAWWQRLHKAYEAAETAGLADAAVIDTVNPDAADTTCTATYLQVLLVQQCTPDALTLAQFNAVVRWVKQWAPLAALTKAPMAGAARQLAVELDGDGGARDAATLQPAPNVRYLDLERLGAMLLQLVAALRNGKSPAELALGAEIRQPGCEALLLLLGAQWCGMGAGRVEERNPSSLKVMVSMSIAAMHYHLTGRAFRQPGAQLSKREEEDMQLFGRVSERTEQALLSQRSGALETWEIINHSRSGILGMCRRPDAATRISHNQLLGLRTAGGRTFYLGVVQRILIDDTGAVSIGLRVIPGTPQPIAARLVGAVAADGQKYDRALLMPADEARKVPESLILAPNSYQPNRAVNLFIEAMRPVKLTAVLDKGINFERCAIADA